MNLIHAAVTIDNLHPLRLPQCNLQIPIPDSPVKVYCLTLKTVLPCAAHLPNPIPCPIEAHLRLAVEKQGKAGGDLSKYLPVNDTDGFEASFNQGYHDKGVYIVVPFSVFKDHDNPLKLLYSFSPWTRDTGQTVRQVHGLYPMANPYTSSTTGNIDSFRRQLDELKD